MTLWRTLSLLIVAAVAVLASVFATSPTLVAQEEQDRDCASFATQEEAQAFFVANGGPAEDPHRLDADNDGIACERNETPPTTEIPPTTQMQNSRSGVGTEESTSAPVPPVPTPDLQERFNRSVDPDSVRK